MITRTWYDPCPGLRPAGDLSFDVDTQFVRDNPEAVLSVRNPACAYDEDDPDSPDCICMAVVNPAPPAYLDVMIPVGRIITMRPCGDAFPRWPPGFHVYQQTTPEPGSLGELLADWAAGDSP